MRNFLKALIFTYLSVIFSQEIFKTFVFLDDKSFWMLVLAFSLLNLFKDKILELVSLPSKGFIYQIISIFLTCLLLNILLAVIPEFRLMASPTPSFNMFGYMVASIYMSAFMNGIASGVTISLTYNFLNWLSSGKSKIR